MNAAEQARRGAKADRSIDSFGRLHRLGEHVRESLGRCARWIHVDVMDGQFVPNITFGPLVVDALRPLVRSYDGTLETHLMIADPDRYLDDFRKAGADVITVHLEACPDIPARYRRIHELGARAGSDQAAHGPAGDRAGAGRPGPGAGHVRRARLRWPEVHAGAAWSGSPTCGGSSTDRGREDVEIGVDGGLNQATLGPVAQAGTTIAVAGSALFNAHASVVDNFQALCRAIQSEPAPSAT